MAPGSDLAEKRRSDFNFFREQLAAPLGQQLESLFGPGTAAPLRVAINDFEAAASLADQLPSVLAAVSRGTSEFTPTPAEVKELLRRAYPAGRAPLIVQFEVDGLDESAALAAALPASARATPLVLPGAAYAHAHAHVQIPHVTRCTVHMPHNARPARSRVHPGTHLTPLAVDPDAPTSALLPTSVLGGLGAAARTALLADAAKLIDAIDGHFDRVAAEKLSAAAAAEWEASQIQPPKAAATAAAGGEAEAAAEVEAAAAAAAVAEAAEEAEALAQARAAEAAEADAADADAEAAKAEAAKAAKAEEVKAEALVAEARAAEAAAARLTEEEAMAQTIAAAKADAMAQAEAEARAEAAARAKAKADAKEVRLAAEEARLKAEAEARAEAEAADAEVVAAEAAVKAAEAAAEAATAAAAAAATVVAAPPPAEGAATEGAANYRELKVPAGKKKKKARKKKGSAD